jgi:hypothetical protein
MLFGYNGAGQFIDYGEAVKTIVLEDIHSIEVKRNGQLVSIPFTEAHKAEVVNGGNVKMLFGIGFPAVIDEVTKDGELE